METANLNFSLISSTDSDSESQSMPALNIGYCSELYGGKITHNADPQIRAYSALRNA